MTVRTFGAVKGAGPAVRENQGLQPLEDGPLGSSLIVGVFRSGPPNTLVPLTDGEPMARRIFGGLTSASMAPLVMGDFYGLGRGSGTLYALRVTDGTEVAAGLPIYDRNVDRSVLERTPPTILAALVGSWSAHNGGRHGGRRSVAAGKVTLGSAITGANTVNLGITPAVDQWVGAVLKFVNDDAAWSAVVTGCTAAGLFTIRGTFPASITGGTDGRWSLELVNARDLTGELDAIAVEIRDSEEDPAGQWSAVVYRNGATVGAGYSDVSMDSSSAAYWIDAIQGDGANYEIAASDSFTGNPADALQRPANYAEIPAPGGVSATSITYQVIRWFFDVVATFADGETVAALPSGTIGTAYASQHAWLPGFTVVGGSSAPSADDVLTIYVRTLPANLSSKGGYLYPAAAPSEGNTRNRYRIVSNDHERVTVSPGADLTALVNAPGAPTMTGSNAGTFDLSAGSLTLIYSIAGDGPYTLTSSLSGATETATAVAADLNALELTRVSSVAADKLIEFGVNDDDKITITALQDYGPGAVLLLGSGTLNTELGFSNAQTATGASPTISRLQWRQEFTGGQDGHAEITDSDYVAAWDLGESAPLASLPSMNTGVVKMATPGVTSPTVQAAMIEHAAAVNAVAYTEIPATILTEAAAIQWHSDNLQIGSATRYHRAPWPSYGRRPNPYGRGLYTSPINGALFGVEARRANEVGGYHLAPAGSDYSIGSIFTDLPTGERALNNEVLNAYGLTEIRKRGAAIYAYGDRIPADVGRPFLHKRLSVSHIGRVLLIAGEALTFKQINQSTFTDGKRLIRGLFLPWFRAGWFDDSNGRTFDDQVVIRIDETNNPTSERNAGNLNASLSFAIADTSERVVFDVNPNGITVRE
jgi:hypothetical protein